MNLASLLRLPCEVRDKIYWEHLLNLDEDHEDAQYNDAIVIFDGKTAQQPAISLTCRQIRQETLPILYSSRWLRLTPRGMITGEPSTGEPYPSGWIQFLRNLLWAQQEREQFYLLLGKANLRLSPTSPFASTYLAYAGFSPERADLGLTGDRKHIVVTLRPEDRHIEFDMRTKVYLTQLWEDEFPAECLAGNTGTSDREWTGIRCLRRQNSCYGARFSLMRSIRECYRAASDGGDLGANVVTTGTAG